MTIQDMIDFNQAYGNSQPSYDSIDADYDDMDSVDFMTYVDTYASYDEANQYLN